MHDRPAGAPSNAGGPSWPPRVLDGIFLASPDALQCFDCSRSSRASPAASPGCRPCKRSDWPWPYLATSSVRSFSPTAATCGSAPTAAPRVPESSRSCGFSSNSSFGGFPFFPRRARLARWHHPIVHCCGPCAVLACLANTTGGFFIVARVSSVIRHWFCALSAIRM